jgi:hypothetical protein
LNLDTLPFHSRLFGMGFFFILAFIFLVLLSYGEIKGIFVNIDDFISINGEIVESEIDKSLSASKKRLYECRIQYKYNVDGKWYLSRGINLGHIKNTIFQNKIEAEEYCTKYKVGQKVQVFYNRKDPDHAVLYLTNKPKISDFKHYIGIFSIGIILIVFGIIKGRNKMI